MSSTEGQGTKCQATFLSCTAASPTVQLDHTVQVAVSTVTWIPSIPSPILPGNFSLLAWSCQCCFLYVQLKTTSYRIGQNFCRKVLHSCHLPTYFCLHTHSLYPSHKCELLRLFPKSICVWILLSNLLPAIINSYPTLPLLYYPSEDLCSPCDLVV